MSTLPIRETRKVCFCSCSKGGCTSVTSLLMYSGLKRRLPRVMRTVGGRTSGVYFVTPTCTSRPGDILTGVLMRLTNTSACGEMFFAGNKTRSGRGTVGVTHVMANEAGVFSYCEDCRKTALNTSGTSNS